VVQEQQIDQDVFGMWRQDDVVEIQTSIYSVADHELLWVGTTQSLNPSDVRRTIGEIAAAVGSHLRDEGLIAPATAP